MLLQMKLFPAMLVFRELSGFCETSRREPGSMNGKAVHVTVMRKQGAR